MTTLYHPRPERWPRFTLRGLFVVVTLVSVWLGMQLKWARDRRVGRQWLILKANLHPILPSEILPWQIRVIGPDPAVGHVDISYEHREKVGHLRSLFPESTFYVNPPSAASWESADFFGVLRISANRSTPYYLESVGGVTHPLGNLLIKGNLLKNFKDGTKIYVRGKVIASYARPPKDPHVQIPEVWMEVCEAGEVVGDVWSIPDKLFLASDFP